MQYLWSPEHEPGDDELEEIFAQDGEAWRGDLHLEGESWRGEEHLADWPEEAAGPEYWMYKGLSEDS